MSSPIFNNEETKQSKGVLLPTVENNNNSEFEEIKNYQSREASGSSRDKESESVSQNYSSSSSSSIDNNRDSLGELGNKKYKSQNYNSVMKSQFLTNLRDSRHKSNILNQPSLNIQNAPVLIQPSLTQKLSQPNTQSSPKFKKSSTKTSGLRLPIRLPSHVDQTFVNKNLNSIKQSRGNLLKLNKQSEKESEERDDSESDSSTETEEEEKALEYFDSFISKSLFTSKFQIIWSLVLFLAHTYHMLAFWYYLGITNYPKGYLLGMQMFFEFFLLIDYLLRL